MDRGSTTPAMSIRHSAIGRLRNLNGSTMTDSVLKRRRKGGYPDMGRPTKIDSMASSEADWGK